MTEINGCNLGKAQYNAPSKFEAKAENSNHEISKILVANSAGFDRIRVHFREAL
jgi:hypothetical protein